MKPKRATEAETPLFRRIIPMPKRAWMTVVRELSLQPGGAEGGGVVPLNSPLPTHGY